MRRFTYAVTFEFETRAPQTHRGVVEAAGVATGMSRAVRETQRALRPINWASLVAVVYDRDPGANRGSLDEPAAAPESEQAAEGDPCD